MTLRRRRGFTLVEVLVATALLSLVTLGLLTAMRSFAQTETRIDERIRTDDDLRATERFLRSVMATVSARPRATPVGAPKQVDFVGGEDAMRWIGVMPARHGAGGLYRFHLYARAATTEAPAALVLEFVPFVPGFEAPLDAAALQTRAMATASGGIRFRYQEDPESGEQWLAQWPHNDRLPRRIGLSVANDRLPWPELVVGILPVAGPTQVGRAGIDVGPL